MSEGKSMICPDGLCQPGPDCNCGEGCKCTANCPCPSSCCKAGGQSEGANYACPVECRTGQCCGTSACKCDENCTCPKCRCT